MKRWQPYAGAALVVTALAVALLMTGSDAAIAQSPTRTSPSPTWWPGAPFATSKVVINAGGVQKCETAFTADAGNVILLTTVSGSFNVPPGGDGSISMKYKLPDGTTHIIEVPMHVTAKALQASGPFDQFTGSLTLGGFPIIEAQTCLIGASSAGQLDFMGYAVPLER